MAERLSNEEAFDEAEKMKSLVDWGQAENYEEANKLIDDRSKVEKKDLTEGTNHAVRRFLNTLQESPTKFEVASALDNMCYMISTVYKKPEFIKFFDGDNQKDSQIDENLKTKILQVIDHYKSQIIEHFSDNSIASQYNNNLRSEVYNLLDLHPSEFKAEKSTEELSEIDSSNLELSDNEKIIMDHIVTGKNSDDLANSLNITRDEAKKVTQIFLDKIGAPNRIQAYTRLKKLGLLK